MSRQHPFGWFGTVVRESESGLYDVIVANRQGNVGLMSPKYQAT